ncbi:hypothetical protein ABZ383_32255 [Streptomyces sp. NPDC005900]|uniref:hypothetical protein n=1 Tax=Streptomyces sp. NPDC005900 TaxID=3154569 RepID=UPI00340FDEC3
MSEEQTPTNEDATSVPADDTPVQPDPEPEPEPVPPPPTGETITWEPQTWYSITYACRTPGCINENQVRAAPMFYSNDGQLKNIRVVDASDDACHKDCVILTAAKLDPQPIEE